MKRSDIKVLVVTKDHGKHNLEGHINALKAYDYCVTVKSNTLHLSGYDIIVAHPSTGGMDHLYEFRNENLQIPMILYSGYGQSSGLSVERKVSKHNGFDIDSMGVYYAWTASMQNFLDLVKSLTGEIYQNKVDAD